MFVQLLTKKKQHSHHHLHQLDYYYHHHHHYQSAITIAKQTSSSSMMVKITTTMMIFTIPLLLLVLPLLLLPIVNCSHPHHTLYPHPRNVLYSYDNEIANIPSHQDAAGHHHHHHQIDFAVTPGVLFATTESYHHLEDSHGYDYRREYSSKLAKIYNKYLNQPTDHGVELCSSSDGDNSDEEIDNIDEGSVRWFGGSGLGGDDLMANTGPYSHLVEQEDFDSAFIKSGRRIEEYERANQEYLSSDPRGLNFSAYIYVSTLHAKYNELVTKHLKHK